MMKRMITLMTIFVLMLALTACGNDTDSQGDDSDSDAQTTAQDADQDTDADDQEASPTLSGSLEIAGSTSVAPLAQALADAFMDENPDVTIQIQSIGSSAGIRAPVDEAAQIGMASRGLSEEEKEWGLTEHVVAIDGIAIVVHPDNQAIDGLTLDQVRQIYVGDIRNWSEVGGDDAEIIVVSREEGSGTRGAFEEIVDYAGELRDDAIIGDGNGNVKSNLITNSNAIAYLSLGFIDEQTQLVAIDGYEGTVENIQSGDYPVSRPLLMLTLGQENELTKAYLEFAMSEAGQEIAAIDYIPAS